jgi:hypothetical protein
VSRALPTIAQDGHQNRFYPAQLIIIGCMMNPAAQKAAQGGARRMRKYICVMTAVFVLLVAASVASAQTPYVASPAALDAAVAQRV